MPVLRQNLDQSPNPMTSPNEPESETPLTDEHVKERHAADLRHPKDYVSADFARTLERDLAAARAEVRELKTEFRCLIEQCEAGTVDAESIKRARGAL